MKLISLNFLVQLINCSTEHNFAKNLPLKKAVTEKFFHGHRSITVFNVDETKTLKTNQILQVLETVAPVKLFDYINENLVNKIHDMGDELDIPKTTTGYFIISESIAKVQKNLKYFSRINTNGKWFVILYDVKKTEVESMLITAFEKFKMLNVLSVYLDEVSELYVSSYFPFEINDNTQRPKIWTQILENKTILEILHQIEDIENKKIANLHQYTLKVSVVDKKLKSEFYDVMDSHIFEVFKKTLNCDFKFIVSRDGTFGSQLSNKNYTGMNQFITF